MSTFEACLLDYGNTIVEFDRGQIEFILEGLHLSNRLNKDVDGPRILYR